MRITSRFATAIAVLAFAVPMFRPLHARDGFRIASVRPPDLDSARAEERETQLIAQLREQDGDTERARRAREAGAARVRRSAYGNRYLVNLDSGFTTGEA